MNIQHEIDKKSGIVKVTATLPPRKGDKVSIREEHVINYLTEQKICISNCVQTAFVSNSIPPYSGTWIFELDNGKSTVVKSMNENKPQDDTRADSPKAKSRRRRKTQTKEA